MTNEELLKSFGCACLLHEEFDQTQRKEQILSRMLTPEQQAAYRGLVEASKSVYEEIMLSGQRIDQDHPIHRLGIALIGVEEANKP